MNELYSIGDVARRTSLTVKTIRNWSDRGLLSPIARTSGGNRRYDDDAVARVELVKTLRDLGIGLSTVRRIVDRQAALADVAKAHADALAIQIGTLQRRHAILTEMAGRATSTEEMTLMHRADEAERTTQIREFLDHVFEGLGDPGFEGIRRSMTPVLPAEPEPEQQDAYAQLAELTRDPDFRRTMRQSAEILAESGIPTSRLAITGPQRKDWDSAVLDPRRHRYEAMLATVNGWAA
ncbi:MerR family transcriptional regulator [Actinoplanes sp. TBRC 11911]|uniref:helix-turn-helix domain-containing protein n=1 Tax=Actinoplanes sp. TBRC 11911 TaxID=2729386 RepID=UPI00145D29A1|nr:MerR family transcriptional regulator [Actinoplanes sp. TBRC 11911]NMO55320.1 MerR family transcriptional regulator [Actinoplanes sp. TBRC 11911]